MTSSVWFGVAIGLLAALMQSLSYIASKIYINRGGSAFTLAVYSQITMGVFGIVTLFLLRGSASIPFTSSHAVATILCVATGALGHFSFFRAVKHIEASRLSSLMGMKIIVIALISVSCLDREILPLQWIAVVLCSVAAVGMNFTGGRLKAHGLFWLISTLVAYAVSDLAVVHVISGMHAPSKILQSISATGLCYMLTGIGALLLLPFAPHRKSLFINAMPYAVIWFGAMILLFLCFQASGVIFGSIIQAMRGIFSVILGIILVKVGFRNIEPSVTRRAWLRRMAMAVLMVLALTLYALKNTAA